MCVAVEPLEVSFGWSGYRLCIGWPKTCAKYTCRRNRYSGLTDSWLRCLPANHPCNFP